MIKIAVAAHAPGFYEGTVKLSYICTASASAETRTLSIPFRLELLRENVLECSPRLVLHNSSTEFYIGKSPLVSQTRSLMFKNNFPMTLLISEMVIHSDVPNVFSVIDYTTVFAKDQVGIVNISFKYS